MGVKKKTNDMTLEEEIVQIVTKVRLMFKYISEYKIMLEENPYIRLNYNSGNPTINRIEFGCCGCTIVNEIREIIKKYVK